MVDAGELMARLKALGDNYAAQLPDKLAQIEQQFLKLPRDHWDEEGFQTMHRMVHSLTGSGKTFGFSLLSDAARNLEVYLKQLAEEKQLLNEEQRKQIEGMFAGLQQVALKRDVVLGGHESVVAVAPDAISSTRRIFLVDDDVVFSTKLGDQLSYFGYEVSLFHTLADFKQAVRKNDDAVVVMDVSFPEDSWGGVHVMMEVQQERETPLPVIFLSANDEFDVRLGAVRAGGLAYFNKSLNISSLIDKLDELTSNQPVAPYRVMIVDDSPSLTSYYATVLEHAGMEVRAVNDPLAVMAPLLEFLPDLILIDMYMPGCDGMELARVIRQLDAFVSIPIVFLSAEKDIDKQLSAMMLGGDDFLTKPIQAPHLVTSVSTRITRSLLLRSFMVRDSLTGLLNHTAIKDQLDREVAHAKRQGTALTFAMVDIDFFKKVNDTYGHPVGDRVIKSLSRLLKQRLRENDSVGRYGGEEFAVILADADGDAALKVMNSIREDFARLQHLADGTEFSATFSCGIADVAEFDDSTLLGEAADRALYQAKRGGRNRVELAKRE